MSRVYNIDLLARIVRKLVKKYNIYYSNNKKYLAGISTFDGNELDYHERTSSWRKRYQEVTRFCRTCSDIISASKLEIIMPVDLDASGIANKNITGTIIKCVNDCRNDIAYYYEAAKATRDTPLKEWNEFTERMALWFETADIEFSCIEEIFETSDISEIDRLLQYLLTCKYNVA
jgi:hypothetical protein